MSLIFKELREISQSQLQTDTLLSSLQKASDRMMKGNLTQKQLHEEHKQITVLFGTVRSRCGAQRHKLSDIKVRMMRSKQDGINVREEQQLYENLVGYYTGVQEKAKRIEARTSEKMQEAQRMSLLGNHQQLDVSDTSHLDNSTRMADEGKDLTRDMHASLQYQSSRLDYVKGKLGNFVGQLNLSKTIMRMVNSRSSQDYKLICFLTALLILQILLCYFFIRPWIHS